MAFLLLAMTGCASTKVFETEGVDQSLTPNGVVTQRQLAINEQVLWGGTILGIQNLEASTQIEILAYPLNSSQRPLVSDQPLGRFILRKAGFLEPNTFTQGRWMTVLGQVESLETGKVGATTYQYPVVDAQQIKLWPKSGPASRGNFTFGIGIRLQN